MRVLITGGYGFIGSHLAEKFHKEGYEVHILDNLSSGKKENVPLKHKSYILNTEDTKCRQIFASYQFDLVIHLADQTNTLDADENPAFDAQSNVVGLVNILQLSKSYGVQKFIFASSTAIYGNNNAPIVTEESEAIPTTSYGISKLAAEVYCKQYAQQSDMDIIVFRLSNVYGPRQHSGILGGVISKFIDDAIHYKPLKIFGDGEQTRDFIYINDVVHALYHAATSVVSGVYNLTSGIAHSINDVAQFVSEKKVFTKIERLHEKNDLQSNTIYSNEKTKRDFDWAPFITLQEGITKTYDWTVLQTGTVKKKVREKVNFKVPDLFHILKPYIENVVLFAVLSFILFIFPLPIITTFIFGIFYIMIIGSFYGNQQGFVAVVLAILLVLGEHLMNGREFFSLLYDTTFLFQISTFLFIGLVVGYSVQRKNIKIAEQQEQLDELQKRYYFLEDIHNEMREIKDELQYRLRNNEESFGKIYSIIKELDNLEPEKIFNKTVQVVERIMRCQGVSIYVFNKYHSFLRLVAHSNKGEQNQIANSIKVEDTDYVKYMIETGKPFINRTLLPNVPLMAVPIYYNNDLRAIISIQQLPFQSFSTYYENLFIVIKELIQSALWRAFEFIKISEQQRYFDNTSVLYYDIFKDIVQMKEEAKETYNMPYIILTMDTHEDDFVTLAEKVEQLLRETDYISYEKNILYVLLSNTKESDLPFVLKRFNAQGLVFREQKQVVI